MLVYNMIFAANEHARRAVEAVRRGKLPSRYLYEKVSARIRWLAPFPYNMVKAKIEFVICEHLVTNISSPP